MFSSTASLYTNLVYKSICCSTFFANAQNNHSGQTGRILHLQRRRHRYLRDKKSIFSPVPPGKTHLSLFDSHRKRIAHRMEMPAAQANHSAVQKSRFPARLYAAHKIHTACSTHAMQIICIFGSGQRQGHRTAHSPDAPHAL